MFEDRVSTPFVMADAIFESVHAIFDSVGTAFDIDIVLADCSDNGNFNASDGALIVARSFRSSAVAAHFHSVFSQGVLCIQLVFVSIRSG
jgi:hypothetical protein